MSLIQRNSFLKILALSLSVAVLSGCNFNEDDSTPSTSNSASPASGQSANSISLSWTAPATRTDGSYISVTELGGYIIHIGTSSTSLRPLVDLSDGTITHYTISDLAAGSYYIAISTYDITGVESSFSQVVQIHVG